MSVYTHKDVVTWVDVWPVTFSKDHARRASYTADFETTAECLRSYFVWWTDGDKRVLARDAFRRIQRHNWLSKSHHIASIARRGIHRPVIVVGVDNRIVDGNHTLMAAAWASYRGPILVLQGYCDADA